jgi:hypothetical protein
VYQLWFNSKTQTGRLLRVLQLRDGEMPSDPDGEPLLLPMTAALQILLHVLVGFMPLLMMKRGLWSSHQQSECEKTAFFISTPS